MCNSVTCFYTNKTRKMSYISNGLKGHLPQFGTKSSALIIIKGNLSIKGCRLQGPQYM